MSGGVLGVVVVNYGSSALLERNLVPLDPAGRPFRVVVVDNFSSAEERTAIARLTGAHGWQLVALPDNRGFGAGVNAGVRAARAAGCECFVLLNPDAVVSADVLEELRQHVLCEPAALVGPRILSSSGELFSEGSRLLLRDGRVRNRRSPTPVTGPEVEWLTGACLAVHDELLGRVGELDESYFLYWEDVELSYRVRAVGGSVVVREDLVAVHDAGGTQGPVRGRAKSSTYYRYNCANRLRFAAGHLPRSTLLRWVWATPAVSREILLRGGRRQLVEQPGLLVAAVRGSLTGLRLALGALLRSRGRGEPGAPHPAVHRDSVPCPIQGVRS